MAASIRTFGDGLAQTPLVSDRSFRLICLQINYFAILVALLRQSSEEELSEATRRPDCGGTVGSTGQTKPNQQKLANGVGSCYVLLSLANKGPFAMQILCINTSRRLEPTPPERDAIAPASGVLLG